MKKTLLAVAFAAFFTAPSFATEQYSDDFSGHRIGIGWSQFDFENFDYGSGLKLEYGYDLNKFVGFSATVAFNDGKESDWYNSVVWDGTSLKFGADLGKAFAVESGFIKPYFALGLMSYSEDGKICSGSSCIRTSGSETSLYYGVGVRGEMNSIYLDANIHFAELDGFDTDQLSFTVGYKF
ncbi:porin family protein [Photobacterium sp. DNB22_13_2]